MLAPLSWLKDYVDLTLPMEALAERLTLAGLAVDAIHHVGDWWDPETITVGRVAAVLPHPDADRLRVCTVDVGGGENRGTKPCHARTHDGKVEVRGHGSSSNPSKAQ